MAENENESLLEKLRERTSQHKLKWEPGVENTFLATLDEFLFLVSRSATSAGMSISLLMKDNQGNELVRMNARRNLTGAQTPYWNSLEDFYTLVKRNAFDVDRKLTKALDLLDKI